MLPGMRVTLMPHQFIGVSWMLKCVYTSLPSRQITDDFPPLGKNVSCSFDWLNLTSI